MTNFSAGASLNNIVFVDGTGIRTLMVSFQSNRGFCCYYIDDLAFTLEDLKVDVDVDVKPGSNPNCTNPRSGGRLPVAVLGSADLDVETIDFSTLNIGGVSPVRCRIEDVPTEIAPGIFTAGDGIADLVCHYRIPELSLPQRGDDCSEITVQGSLLDGTFFEGSDTVCVPGDPTCEAGEPLP